MKYFEWVVNIFLDNTVTLDQIINNLDTQYEENKVDKDIKGFVQAAFKHLRSSLKQIKEKNYAAAILEMEKLCSETEQVFKVLATRVTFL